MSKFELVRLLHICRKIQFWWFSSFFSCFAMKIVEIEFFDICVEDEPVRILTCGKNEDIDHELKSLKTGMSTIRYAHAPRNIIWKNAKNAKNSQKWGFHRYVQTRLGTSFKLFLFDRPNTRPEKCCRLFLGFHIVYITKYFQRLIIWDSRFSYFSL